MLPLSPQSGLTGLPKTLTHQFLRQLRKQIKDSFIWRFIVVIVKNISYFLNALNWIFFLKSNVKQITNTAKQFFDLANAANITVIFNFFTVKIPSKSFVLSIKSVSQKLLYPNLTLYSLPLTFNSIMIYPFPTFSGKEPPRKVALFLLHILFEFRFGCLFILATQHSLFSVSR